MLKKIGKKSHRLLAYYSPPGGQSPGDGLRGLSARKRARTAGAAGAVAVAAATRATTTRAVAPEVVAVTRGLAGRGESGRRVAGGLLVVEVIAWLAALLTQRLC